MTLPCTVLGKSSWHARSAEYGGSYFDHVKKWSPAEISKMIRGGGDLHKGIASRYSCECHMEKSSESWVSAIRWNLAKRYPDRIRWVTQGFVRLFGGMVGCFSCPACARLTAQVTACVFCTCGKGSTSPVTAGSSTL